MKSRILSRRGFFKGIAIIEGSSLLGVDPLSLDGLESARALNKKKGNRASRATVPPENLEMSERKGLILPS